MSEGGRQAACHSRRATACQELRLCDEPAQADRHVVWRAAAHRPEDGLGLRGERDQGRSAPRRQVAIIDFALSNALNSGIRRISVATQYKAHSLIRRGWNFLRAERNESFDILSASQRVAENKWYEGTADAVTQNIDIIESYAPEYMLVLAGDHVYKMDYEIMLQATSIPAPT